MDRRDKAQVDRSPPNPDQRDELRTGGQEVDLLQHAPSRIAYRHNEINTQLQDARKEELILLHCDCIHNALSTAQLASRRLGWMKYQRIRSTRSRHK